MTAETVTTKAWRYEVFTQTIRDEKNHWIATVDSFDGAVDNAANATLIAAAPALLDALEFTLSMLEETHDPCFDDIDDEARDGDCRVEAELEHEAIRAGRAALAAAYLARP